MEYLRNHQHISRSAKAIIKLIWRMLRETDDDEFTYFVPRMSLYLREFEFSVGWIHTFDFLPCWCSENLLYTNQKGKEKN